MSYAWPVPGYKMSTAYGIKGQHWRACGWHTGIDIAAPTGTPILAPEDGDIRARSYGSSFGSKAFALSPDGPGEWFFAHVSWRVPIGTRVRKGQHIANVGSEGNATGPHLHLEYHPNKQNWSCGNMKNPMDLLSQSGGGSPPPSGGGWQFPAGHKVYQKYLKVDGHELNQDRVSDSIKALQEMLNKHSMPGGANMPITGKYWTASDKEVRLCQSLHLPPADPEMKSFVGAKQWEHLKAATNCPYEFVPGDNAIAPPPPTTPPPPSDRPGEPSSMLPGAIWDPISKKDGGWFTGLRPFTGNAKKVTIHTTETSVKPNWVQQGSGIPHFTLDLASGKAWQHLPLDVAAYTLLGGDAGQSPNSDSGSNIQLEVIGYSADIRSWSDEQYSRLAGVLAWLSGATGVPLEFPVEFKVANQAKRLSWGEWQNLSGILGHEHAPFNDHSDPGALDISRLVSDTPPPPPPNDSDSLTREEFDAWRKRVADAMMADWG